MKFATLYDEGMKPSEGIIFTEPSMTDQSQYQESDINYIVKKYADGRTGITTLDLGADAGVLQYGDTLLPGDYDTALDLINAVSDDSTGHFSVPDNGVYPRFLIRASDCIDKTSNSSDTK